MTTQTFSFTGVEDSSFVVPANVLHITIDCQGAAGGGQGVSGGGRVQTTLAVTPGTTLRVGVGGVGTTIPLLTTTGGAGGFYAGAAGGAAGAGGTIGGSGGGGQSYIKQGGAADTNRVIVAGGGGGGWNNGTAGGGGGVVQDTQAQTASTATAGVTGGAGQNGGGGGGGGWRGGAGGTQVGGAGGSNMVNTTVCASTTHTASFQGSNGTVVFTYFREFSQSATTTVTGTSARGSLAIGKKPPAVTITGTPAMTRRISAARTAAVTATGTAALGKALVAARSFVLTVTGTPSLRVDMSQAVLNRIASGGTPDWPLNAPVKHITGVTRDSVGAIVVSATVKLIRMLDDVTVQTAVSNATTGVYSFARGVDDPYSYRAVATKAGAPEIHGVSDVLAPT